VHVVQLSSRACWDRANIWLVHNCCTDTQAVSGQWLLSHGIFIAFERQIKLQKEMKGPGCLKHALESGLHVGKAGMPAMLSTA
jgi:hypothetical protein